MAWTYSSAPSTGSSAGRRDAIRILVNDRFTTRQLVQDAIITFALAQESNNLYRAAAWVADSLADSEAVAARVGDLSIGGEKPTNYRTLARQLRHMGVLHSTAMPIVEAISSQFKQSHEADTDRVLPFFTRQMMANNGVLSGTTST